MNRRIFVTDDIGPVGFLNELEFAEGKLYATVWQSDLIAVIRTVDGEIAGWIDLTGLNPDPTVLSIHWWSTASLMTRRPGVCW